MKVILNQSTSHLDKFILGLLIILDIFYSSSEILWIVEFK